MYTLRHAFRAVRKAPWVSAVIIISLAIGVGTNTVVFSWLKSQISEPLPRVVAPVWSLETKDDTGNYVTTSWLEYRDLRESVSAFDGVAAQRPRSFAIGNSEEGERVFGELVSANFFDVLGLNAERGRFFRPEEASRPGGEPVAVISHSLWQRRFHGDANVVGQSLELNQHTFTIIGVAPERFRGGMNLLSFEVWVPLTMANELQPASTELTSRTTRPYLMLARLKPGATQVQAQTELNAAAQHFLAAYPETNKGLRYELLPLWRIPRGGQSVVLALATLQFFAALILIIVCANTANLLLARAKVREQEIGVRLALGASAARIIGQLLSESLILALLAVAGGFLFALWAVDLLAQIPLPANLPFNITPHLDYGSVIFALLVGAACGFIFGLAPARQLARRDILESLRGGRGSVAGGSRTRDFLVGVQVAVALVILVLAGLVLKSFRNSLGAHPGFDADRVMLASVDLGGHGYTQERANVFLTQLRERLEALPEVAAASAASNIPLDVRGIDTGVIDVEGADFDPVRKTLYYSIAPGYIATMGMSLVDGHDIAPLTRNDLPLDALINEEMARRYWPGVSALGRRFEVGGKFYEIAGVVRNAKYVNLNESPRPLAWLTMRAQLTFAPTLHVRARSGDPRHLLAAMRETAAKLDPALPLLEPRTLEQHLDDGLFMQRIPARMLSILGPLALALSAIGLYALLAFSLAQRTREIALRLTLGATPRGVVWFMIWQHLRVVLISAVIGLAAAFALHRLISDSLVGIRLGEPIVYLGASSLLLVVALLACWLPARRAASIDPASALRSE